MSPYHGNTHWAIIQLLSSLLGLRFCVTTSDPPTIPLTAQLPAQNRCNSNSAQGMNVQSEDLAVGSGLLLGHALLLLESSSSPTLLNGDHSVAGPAFPKGFWKERCNNSTSDF